MLYGRLERNTDKNRQPEKYQKVFQIFGGLENIQIADLKKTQSIKQPNGLNGRVNVLLEKRLSNFCIQRITIPDMKKEGGSAKKTVSVRRIASKLPNLGL